MERKDRVDLFGAIMLVATSATYGLNQALIKIVNGGLQPVFQAGLRSLFAILPILIFAWLTKKKLSLTDGSFPPALIAGSFFAGEFILLYQALDYTTVARASIFFYTMPFWAAIGAHFLIPGERLTWLRSGGLVLAFIGVILALSNNAEPATDKAFVGDLFCLLGAILWAGILLIARTTKFSRACPEMQLLYQVAISSVILLAVAPFFGELVRDFTPAIAGIFAIQVLGVVCVGFLTWFWLLSIYPASDMASFGFLAPVFGVFFGWLIFDEALGWVTILALLLVGIGIVLVNRKPKAITVQK
ncbi:MAG: DMT family transporter [Pseudomonadota bacterium]